MKKIGHGAEALILLDKGKILKERISKSYRHSQIDISLRKYRTRREAKILQKLTELGFPSPRLISSCDTNMYIRMEFIKGKKLRDVLDSNPSGFGNILGKLIAILHANDIIHGDLTTSNMIVNDEGLFFIDFGLSFFSKKIEDMAVDLHLLRQALESKHYKCWKECFDSVLGAYLKELGEKGKKVIVRLSEVEKRGRYKRRKFK